MTAPERPPVAPARTFAKGFLMGCADVVPGVSGGTMALITGIWERLIEAIRSFDPAAARLVAGGRIKEAWTHVDGPFLAPLFAGIAVAIVSLARAIEHALAEHPEMVFAFFFGLVAASVYAVHDRLGRWSVPAALAAVVGAGVAYGVVGLVPVETPATPLWFLGSGAIAISAMILPGISGSFILLLMGKYSQVITAIGDFDLVTIGFVGTGCVLGLLLFVRVLHWVLERAHDLTMAVLIGLMCGSLRKIWPWKETVAWMEDRHGELVPLQQRNLVPDLAAGSTWIGVGLAVLGLVGVLAIHAYSNRGTPPAAEPEPG